jgi:probable rRNA maturation factor
MSPLQLDFSVENGLDGTWDEPRLLGLVRAIVSRELPSGSYTLSLHLVSDATMRTLNATHRQKDAATDVLSFPLHELHVPDFVLPPGQPIALGDVLVSYPRAVAQAEEYGHSTERELAYLVAHGVLHVLGYDHDEVGQRRAMRAREEQALMPLGLTR